MIDDDDDDDAEVNLEVRVRSGLLNDSQMVVIGVELWGIGIAIQNWLKRVRYFLFNPASSGVLYGTKMIYIRESRN